MENSKRKNAFATLKEKLDSGLPANRILLDEYEASVVTDEPVDTLRQRRFVGGGAPFIKQGRNVRYRLSDLDDYLTSKVRLSTSQAQAA